MKDGTNYIVKENEDILAEIILQRSNEQLLYFKMRIRFCQERALILDVAVDSPWPHHTPHFYNKQFNYAIFSNQRHLKISDCLKFIEPTQPQFMCQ